ncbi:MAG: GNAT family N-acetyltransferase [Candidatus Fermentibacteria bacterium]|nr:GNAT family N-acetyltransferase [Candidatus Fermentibacteria bacterium]
MNSVLWPDKFPVIQTERLVLRQVATEDTEGLFLCYSDPEVMKYLATPLDNEDAIEGILEDYKDGFNQGYNLIWSIIIRETGAFAGTAGFEEFSFLDCKADIGFSLLRKHQGKGYMEEALSKIVAYGFQELNLNRIQTTVVPENTASVKLLNRLGFQKEGHMKQSVFFNNSFHDELMFAVLNNAEETG